MIVVVTPESFRDMHDEDNPSCWCEPRVDVINGVPMISHNCTDPGTKWLAIEKPVSLKVGRA